jgi:hypothetical protein
MLIQEDYIKTAARYLAILAEYTSTMSTLNLHDCSVVSENFFVQLLNVVYDYKLKNINLVSHNAAAIDLYDLENRVSVQVTSTRTLTKVKDCLEKFHEKKLYQDYDKLFIYILTHKQNSYKMDAINTENFKFDSKVHIIDKDDLLKRMLDLEPAIQKKVVDILQSGIKLPSEIKTSVSNEVDTLINLITLLSNNISQKPFDEESIIDHNKKKTKRFKDMSSLIEDQYFDLCISYEPILNSAQKNNDIDSVKHSKVSGYLRDKSTRLLVDNKHDAMKAFDILMVEVTDLFKEVNINYDEMAVKFYLLKSLTQCNVFPLLRSEMRV